MYRHVGQRGLDNLVLGGIVVVAFLGCVVGQVDWGMFVAGGAVVGDGLGAGDGNEFGIVGQIGR